MIDLSLAAAKHPITIPAIAPPDNAFESDEPLPKSVELFG